MTNITKIQEAAERKGREASVASTFNFLDRLAGRNYPTEDVVIYLDEQAAYQSLKLSEKISRETDSDAVAKLEEELAALHEALGESKYIIHLEGISTEEYDAVIDEGIKQYPVEYDESTHPLTFAKTKTPRESEERSTYYRTHMWAKYIRSIEDNDGNVDTNITPELVAAFLNHAPVGVQYRIAEAVETLRMTTDWMDTLQSDDFFPKS